MGNENPLLLAFPLPRLSYIFFHLDSHTPIISKIKRISIYKYLYTLLPSE